MTTDHWEMSVRPSKAKGSGELTIKREWDGRILRAYISEDFKEIIITASNRTDLDRGIKSYEIMRESLPNHRPLKIVRDDDQTSVVAAD